MGNTRTISKT